MLIRSIETGCCGVRINGSRKFPSGRPATNPIEINQPEGLSMILTWEHVPGTKDVFSDDGFKNYHPADSHQILYQQIRIYG